MLLTARNFGEFEFHLFGFERERILVRHGSMDWKSSGFDRLLRLQELKSEIPIGDLVEKILFSSCSTHTKVHLLDLHQRWTLTAFTL